MITRTYTSPFLPDALAAMGTRRVLILDGAIDDDVLLYDQPTSVTNALADTWADASDAIAARWTPGGGLESCDPEDRPHLEALLRSGGADGDLQAAVGDSPLDRRDPLDIAMLLVTLFEQRDQRVLLVIEHADLILIAGADPYSRRVNAAALQAVEAFEASEELHAIVLLCHDLGSLPPALSGRPGVARLRIPAPSGDARRATVTRAFDLPSDDVSAERLAIAADGFGLRELAMLPAHARATGLTLQQPRELLSSFRNGHRVDPWASLTAQRMSEIRAGVHAQVFGQDRAVGEILDRLDVARSGLELDPPTSGTRKSRLELFLVGPTGVGKNEIARAIARELFGDPGAVMVFDMSAFQQEHSGEQLFGAPPGYVGHERGSPLVDRLRERPFSVIVFDEIEKAHPNNWLRLMGAVDEGRVRDGRGVQASLEDAVVIFTSNIGGDVLLERAAESPLNTEQVEALTLSLVEAHLTQTRYAVAHDDTRAGIGKPEVWGRLSGSVVAFDLLRPDAVARIVGRFCDTLSVSAQRTLGITLDIDVRTVTAAVATRLGPPGTWNGRLIRGHVDRLLRRPLALELAGAEGLGGGRVSVSLNVGGELRFGTRA